MTTEAMIDENPKKEFGDFLVIKIDDSILTIDQLRELSQRYSESHHGRKLAHSFPGNDKTAAVPPSNQYSEKDGAGLAIPYQKEQTKSADIWVAPIPSSFFSPANRDVPKQQSVIRHYIAGLYYQVALANGISVPIRRITGPSGSETHSQSFAHPARHKDIALALPEGYEYAWGVGVDPHFTKNHGTFLEQELNKLNTFMLELRNAVDASTQQKLITSLESDYYRAFTKAQEEPGECYGAYIEPTSEELKLLPVEVIEKGDKGYAEYESLRESLDLSPDALVQHLSLAPSCLTLKSILDSVVIPDELKADVDASIQELNHIEMRYHEEQAKKAQYDLAKKQLESAEFWNMAKEQFLALTPNKGITIDTSSEPPKFSIRTNLAQKRHVTPVVVVERIFKRIFQRQAIPEDLIKGLLHHLEIFLHEEENKDLVQGLFDYYKHPEVQNGAEHLFKLLAHFYNQFPSLAFDDDYIKITYKTENCYIMPTLEYCGTKLSYDMEGGEGVFVKMLSKLLETFNWIANLNERMENNYDPDFSNLDIPSFGKKRLNVKAQMINQNIREKKHSELLTMVEINQAAYAIYAMLDYLPLPVGKIDPTNKKLKEGSQRYSREAEERLFELAANHLHFIFAAYTSLRTYQDEIIENFLKFTIYGVSKAELKSLLQTSADIKQVKEYLESDSKLDKYTNALGGNARGFAQQYCTDPSQYENFYIRMKKQVTTLLETRMPSQALELASASSSPRSGSAGSSDPSSPGSEKEVMKGKQRSIADLSINILIAAYENPENVGKDFSSLSLESRELIGINIERFTLLFQGQMLSSEKIKELRKTKVRSQGDKPRSAIIHAFLQLQEETKDIASSMTVNALDEKIKKLNDLLLSLPGGKDLQLELSSIEADSSEQKVEGSAEAEREPIFAELEARANLAQREIAQQEHLREENFAGLVNEITGEIENVEIKYTIYTCVIKHTDSTKLVPLIAFLVGNNITFTFLANALAIPYGQLESLRQLHEYSLASGGEAEQPLRDQPAGEFLRRGSKRAFGSNSGPSSGEEELPRSPTTWDPRLTPHLASLTDPAPAQPATSSVSRSSSKRDASELDVQKDETRKKSTSAQPPKSPTI